MNIKEFLSPKRIWFHIVLAIGITLVIVIVSMISLKFFTRHGEEIEMPDFVGKDSEVLIANSKSNDFVIVVSDYFFDKSQKPGIIIKQNPEAGEKVKMGRKVYVTVASSVPPKVPMPELKDVSLRQAEIMLKASGLELGNVIYKQSPFENAVLEQLYKGRSISPGTEINKGDVISLVVGKNIENLPDENTEPAEENEAN